MVGPLELHDMAIEQAAPTRQPSLPTQSKKPPTPLQPTNLLLVEEGRLVFQALLGQDNSFQLLLDVALRTHLDLKRLQLLQRPANVLGSVVVDVVPLSKLESRAQLAHQLFMT